MTFSWHPYTFFFFTIKFIDCVELRSQADKLHDYFTTSLILKHSWILLVDSCWNARRMVWCEIWSVEFFLGVSWNIFEQNLLFRFHSKDCQCLWTTDLPSGRIFSWCIYNENQGLWQIQNAHSEIDWFIENQFRLLHVHCDKIFIKYNAMIKVWFCRAFFQRRLVIDQPDIHPVANILHRLSEDAVVHEFEKIFLKLVLRLGTKVRIQLNVWF